MPRRATALHDCWARNIATPGGAGNGPRETMDRPSGRLIAATTLQVKNLPIEITALDYRFRRLIAAQAQPQPASHLYEEANSQTLFAPPAQIPPAGITHHNPPQAADDMRENNASGKGQSPRRHSAHSDSGPCSSPAPNPSHKPADTVRRRAAPPANRGPSASIGAHMFSRRPAGQRVIPGRGPA